MEEEHLETVVDFEDALLGNPVEAPGKGPELETVVDFEDALLGNPVVETPVKGPEVEAPAPAAKAGVSKLTERSLDADFPSLAPRNDPEAISLF